MQSRNKKNLTGIDISNWQGNVNMAAVKNAGIEVVYCKATESNFFKDAYAKANYCNAKAQGLKVGFYHFFRGDTNAKEQANFFINFLREIGADNYDCKLALDIETAEGVSKYNLTTMCIDFLEEVKRLTGKEVVVYTYTSFANSNLDNRLSKYPLWIAHYGVNTPGYNPIWSSWVGFQYTSDGNIAGLSGRIDMNEFTPEIFLSGDDNKPVNPPMPPKNNIGKVLILSSSVESWRVYPTNKAPVVGNEVGFLAPSQFGGLSYEILGNPQTDVYTIQTESFGMVNIYAPRDNDSSIVNKTASGSYVNLKPHVSSWRVYPINKAAVVGNEVGFLAPSQFRGLSYQILGNPQNNVYTIQTQSFGKVNIFAPRDNDSSITNTPIY